MTSLREWLTIRKPKRQCSNLALLDRGTRRRAAILEFVLEYQEQHGYGPCIREIGEAVGLKSSSSVWFHLLKLQQEGRVSREAHKPRCVASTLAPASRDFASTINAILELLAARAPHEQIEHFIREAVGSR
jgi:SOS-response transcriptional repressor LexA